MSYDCHVDIKRTNDKDFIELTAEKAYVILQPDKGRIPEGRAHLQTRNIKNLWKNRAKTDLGC